jgi:hypothetical protein
MVWMQWYLGPVLLAAAIVALALLVRALIRGHRWYAVSALAFLGPASAVYLWRPNITADQIWVMRRFLFSALPLFTLLGFGLVAALVRYRPRRVPRAAPITLAVVIATAGIASPVRALKPVANITDQRGYLLALRDACRIAGKDAAIVLLQTSPSRLFYTWAPQSFRSWCNVPVVAMVPTSESRATLAQLATAWQREGRKLWVAADADTTIHKVFPAARVQQTHDVVNPYMLEGALLHRPGAYAQPHFVVALAPVAPGG